MSSVTAPQDEKITLELLVNLRERKFCIHLVFEEVWHHVASYPGRMGGERRPGIDCLRMRDHEARHHVTVPYSSVLFQTLLKTERRAWSRGWVKVNGSKCLLSATTGTASDKISRSLVIFLFNAFNLLQRSKT